MNWLFFIDQAALIAAIIAGASLTITIAAEMLWPRRSPSAPVAWRWGNNLGLANVVLILLLADWTTVHRLGLFHQFSSGFWLPLLTLFVTLQFITYLTHIAFHRIPWLWRLHAIHHSDVDVDISTNLRHHPLEPLVFMPVLLTVVTLLGVSFEVALTYQIIGIFLNTFAHTNVRLPPKLDRILNKVLVTPDFHRVHHSSERTYTNSNYGNIVPWFDYLFGTAKSRRFEEHESFELGLEYGRDGASNRVDRMLMAPLRRQGSTDKLSI